ncbi:MAG: YcaO-like family protein [Candidatus Saganbacteria bacterium]|nr:YcaO-like family protein [Candidatus Saganbacteria bacterium]
MNTFLKDAFKYNDDGLDKIIPPSETIKKATLALGNAKMPISFEIEKIDYINKPKIPSFVCKIQRATGQAYGLQQKYSWGKGVTQTAARASAIMELIERASCSSFLKNENNFKTGSYSYIKKWGNPFKDSILACSEKFRRDLFLCNLLKKACLKWTNSFSLTKNKNILFPLDWFAAFQGTNGYAAGNSIEEATLQGLCEAVERYAISTIMKKKYKTPAINIDSINNRTAKEIITKLKRAGIKLYIKDFSLDLEIPTIAVIINDPKSKDHKYYYTAGTSINRNLALVRALNEVAQIRNQIVYGAKKLGITVAAAWCFPDFKDFAKNKFLIENSKKIDFSDLPTYSNRNIKKEIEVVVSKLKDKGLEVIVTDTTHHILKIPTVIVTIPGTFTVSSNSINPYLVLIEHNEKMQNHQNNIKIFKRYFQMNPEEKKKGNLLYSFGKQHEKTGKYKQAIKIFNETTSFCNKDNPGWINMQMIYCALIRCYSNLSKPEEVLKIYRKLKKLQQNTPQQVVE